MLNRVSKLEPVEVKLIAYFALIYSRLVYSFISWGKRTQGIKVQWIREFDICKNLPKLESFFSYFIRVKFNKINRLYCHPYLLRKIKIQDTRHEHRTRFIVCNYNVPFSSKSKSLQSFFVSVYPCLE